MRRERAAGGNCRNGKRSAENGSVIRGVQFKGEIRRLEGEESDPHARRTIVAFRLPECCRPRYGNPAR